MLLKMTISFISPHFFTLVSVADGFTDEPAGIPLAPSSQAKPSLFTASRHGLNGQLSHTLMPWSSTPSLPFSCATKYSQPQQRLYTTTAPSRESAPSPMSPTTPASGAALTPVEIKPHLKNSGENESHTANEERLQKMKLRRARRREFWIKQKQSRKKTSRRINRHSVTDNVSSENQVMRNETSNAAGETATSSATKRMSSKNTGQTAPKSKIKQRKKARQPHKSASPSSKMDDKGGDSTPLKNPKHGSKSKPVPKSKRAHSRSHLEGDVQRDYRLPDTVAGITKYALEKALQIGGSSNRPNPSQSNSMLLKTRKMARSLQKYPSSRVVMHGVRQPRSRTPRMTSATSSSASKRLDTFSSRFIRRGKDLVPLKIDAEMQRRQRRKSMGIEETPTDAERLILQKRAALHARRHGAATSPNSRGEVGKDDVMVFTQQTNQALSDAPVQNSMSVSGLRSEPLQTAVEVETAASTSPLKVDIETLYQAFILPFQAKYVLGDWRSGPRGEDNANPKQHMLRQLRFLERRFEPAFAVWKSVHVRWRQSIWQVAVGIKEDEIAKLGQLSIRRETLPKVMEEFTRRRNAGRPRIRDDSLWNRVVASQYTQKSDLEKMGLNPEEIFVWWHVRQKFRAHIEREMSMSITRRKLRSYLAGGENPSDKDAEELQRCFARGQHLLNEWDDIARNVQRELWMFTMGVPPGNLPLRKFVKSDLHIDMEDVRAGMHCWITMKSNWGLRSIATSHGYLLRMKEALRTNDALPEEMLAKGGIALRRAGEQLPIKDSEWSTTISSDEEIGVSMIKESQDGSMSHAERRAAQKLAATERMVNVINRQLYAWRKELYTILTGISFDQPKTHQYISLKLIEAAVQDYKKTRHLYGEVPQVEDGTGSGSIPGQASSLLKSSFHYIRTQFKRRDRKQRSVLPKKRGRTQAMRRPGAIPHAAYSKRFISSNVAPEHERIGQSESPNSEPEILKEVRTIRSQIAPTSRQLAPLRRTIDVDELPTIEQSKANEKTLTHLSSTGEARMVSVAAKPDTQRAAIAVGQVRFSNTETYKLVTTAALKKGDVLSISRIAGIQAAKMCPSIIPLCHPIIISSVKVDVVPFQTDKVSGIGIECKVECTGPTGVEMEAMTAVMGAALTVIDMVKAVDKAATIEDVKVVYKSGGKSGNWIDDEWAAGRKPIQ